MRPLARSTPLWLAILLGGPAMAQNECNQVPQANCPTGTGSSTQTTQDQHGPVGPVEANWSSVAPHQNLVPRLMLDKFVPTALQTLVQAEVRIRAIPSGQIRIENEGAVSCNDTVSNTTIVHAEPNPAIPGLPALDLALPFSQMLNLATFDGTLDFGGPSGATLPITGLPEERCYRFTDPTVLATHFTDTMPMDGTTEQIEFDHAATANSSHVGCSPVTFAAAPFAHLQVEIRYLVCTSGDCDNDGIPDGEDDDISSCGCLEFHRRMCGSLLLYPELDNTPGCMTLVTVTMGCCEDVQQDANVEFRFINKQNCLKTDRTFRLTPCDTLTFIADAVSPNPVNGYIYAYAKAISSPPPGGPNPTGTPIVFNRLIGQELIIDGIHELSYGMNAVSFKAFGSEREDTDRDQDGIRDLNGPGPDGEYEQAPDRIFIPRFLGQDGPGRSMVNSDLILLNLSGGAAFTTTVDFLIFNDNEDGTSGQYEFYCWDKVKLRDFSGATRETFLDDLETDDPDEILGMSSRTAGWIWIDGNIAVSSAEAILDPAVYAVLVERVGYYTVADLPWEYCSQANGDLLPLSVLGDGPVPVNDDNQ